MKHANCTAGGARPGPYTDDQCRVCWRAMNPAGVRPGLFRQAASAINAVARHVRHGLPAATDAEKARRLAICNGCEYFDAARGRCKACGCFVKIKAVMAMEKCPKDKWVIAPITTRHLCYHIYPISRNRAWQWNVRELCKRMPLFNGKRIVAIAVDPPEGRKPDPAGPHAPDGGRFRAPCDTVDAVKAAFGEYASTIEFIEAENDPSLREVKTLVPMLERLPHAPGHATLYAHAKGTTRGVGHVARRWTQTQYELYLDYWPAVDRELKSYPVTGAYKKLGPGWSPEQTRSDWHYSGSWFWFRNDDLFRREWQTVDQFWSGIEPYPSQQFLAQEAGCLFHTAAVPAMNLYDPKYWRLVVTPEYERWKQEHEKDKTVYG